MHYCDVANELDVIRTALAHDRDARRAEVSVTTGAGFGVVATEALALALRGNRPPDGRRGRRPCPEWPVAAETSPPAPSRCSQ